MDYEDGQNSSFNGRRSFSPSKRGFFPGRRGGSFPSRRGFRSSTRGFRGGRSRGNFNNDRYFGRGGAHQDGNFVPRGRGFHHDGNFVPRGRGRGSPRSRRPFRGGPANRFPITNKSSKENLKGVKLFNEAPFRTIQAYLKTTACTEDKDESARKLLAEAFDGYEVNVVLTALGSTVFVSILRAVSLDVVSPTLSKIVRAAGFLGSNFIGSKTLGFTLKALGEKLEEYHAELADGKVGELKLRIDIASCEDFVCKIAAKVVENLGELIYDVTTEYVFKVLLPMLVGKKLVYASKSDWVLEEWKFPIPSALPKLLERSKQIIMEVDADRMLKGTPANSVRTLLHVLLDCDPDLCDRTMGKIFSSKLFAIDRNAETANLPVGFTESDRVYLVKDVMKIMPPSSFQNMLETYRPVLAAMAEHPVAKIVLYEMIQVCHKKKQILTVFAELKPVFEKLKEEKLFELFVYLAGALIRHGCKEKMFMKVLKSALDYKDEDDKSFLEFLLTMLISKSPEDRTASQEKFQGSKLLEVLLQCTESREVATGLLALDSDLLVKASMDKQLSGVIVALLKSSCLTEEEKANFVNKMMGKLAFATCDQHGLAVVVEMWRCSDQPSRHSMAQELAKEYDTLAAHYVGRVACTMFKLEELMKTPKKWTKLLGEEIENGINNIIGEEKAEVADKSQEVDSDDEDDAVGDAETDDDDDDDDDQDEADDDQEEEKFLDDEAEDDGDAEMEESVDEDDDEDDDDEEEEDVEIPKNTSLNSSKRKMNSAPAKSPVPKSKKQKKGKK